MSYWSDQRAVPSGLGLRTRLEGTRRRVVERGQMIARSSNDMEIDRAQIMLGGGTLT